MAERKRNIVRAMILIACATGLTLVGSANGTSAVVANTHVLTEHHHQQLDALLETKKQGKLDGRLDFQKTERLEDRIIVRYGQQADGKALFAVTLYHPSLSDGAAATMSAFAIHEKPGLIDPGALIALSQRLRRLDVASFWPAQKPQEADESIALLEGGSNEPENISIWVRKEMKRIRYSFQIGDVDSALEMMSRLSANRQARVAMGLDLVELWWELGKEEKAFNTLSKWHKEAPPSKSMLVKWRARALLSKNVNIVAVLSDIASTNMLCRIDVVARAIAATGQTQEARQLLREARPLRNCFDVRHQELQWMIGDGNLAEADRLSLMLMESGASDRGWNVRARSLRAEVLLLMNKPKEAVLVLEKVTGMYPEKVPISLLLKTFRRVDDSAWTRSKRMAYVERFNSNPQEHFAALLAGIMVHHEGDFEGSDKLLKPLLGFVKAANWLFIVLAMNALSLGKLDEALELMGRTKELAPPGPEIHYFRAEILRWSKPDQALDNLHRYLSYLELNHSRDLTEEARIRKMVQMLDQCLRKQASIPCPGPWTYTTPPTFDATSRNGNQQHGAGGMESYVWLLLSGACLIVAGYVWRRRRRT